MSRAAKLVVTVGLALGLPALCAVAHADSPPPAPYFGPGDLDGNFRMTSRDFALFCKYWIDYQTNGTFNAKADLDRNSILDIRDAALFVREWIKTEPTRVTTTQQASTPEAPAQEQAPQ